MYGELKRNLFKAYALDGMNYDLIAKKLKIDVWTCFQWRKQMGIPPRPRGKGAPCRKGKKEAKKKTSSQELKPDAGVGGCTESNV
jgi:transposase